VPSRLLSRGVRQDANESRNTDLDGERMTQIEGIFSRQRTKEQSICFCTQARVVLPKQNSTVVVGGWRRGTEDVDMDS
jgi:hypothetical protein